jgi:DNA-binding NtrC family response regulator/pSer/pThr/pTyr-binding forkhead associated (FHA) protein
MTAQQGPDDPPVPGQVTTTKWDEATRDTITSYGAAAVMVPGARAPAERHYLLVFEPDSSSLFELPCSGTVLIGRAEHADLQLRDSSVSRQHAKVVTDGGEVQIADVGSSNGTRVNGERIPGPHSLVSGDVVGIANITLAYHSSVRVAPTRVIHELASFRQRAEEEVERALRYGRPLTFLAVTLAGSVDGPRAAATLDPVLRLMDVVGWGGVGQLLVLVPELGPAEADAACRRILERVLPLVPEARVGVATCPADGCDVDALLAAARATALEVRGGVVAASSHAYRELTVGKHRIIVADPAMVSLFTLVERLAAADLPVLVYGETGTGKELVATALHEWSARRSRPLVACNCAAIQETLVESELFGYERGAFSGAVGSKPGLLERASGGTVLLDEIGDLSAPAQAKLLRALETKRVLRLGDVREREIDLRIVAATNRNLQAEVTGGRFRQDLFFRLSGGMVWLPPLRDRRRELPILARVFLAEACARAGRPPMSISEAGMRALLAHGWPGNVRELLHLMEYAAAAVAEGELQPAHLASRLAGAGVLDSVPSPVADEVTGVLGPPLPGAPPVATTPGAPSPPPVAHFRPLEEEVRELERGRMEQALAATAGNQTRAAELIGMPLRTFQTKLKQYGLGPTGGRLG